MNKYSLSAKQAPGTILGAGDMAVDQTSPTGKRKQRKQFGERSLITPGMSHSEDAIALLTPKEI